MFDFLLLLTILGFMLAASRALAWSEQRASGLQRILRAIEDDRAAVARRMGDLREQIKSAEATAARLDEEIDKLIKEAEELTQTLARLDSQPREKVYVMDRGPVRSLRLWEAVVMHDGLSRHGVEAFARTWSVGRRYLLCAETETLARRRAEQRFPSETGYRVIGLKAAVLSG